MFCPNDECPDYLNSGLRAEYRDDIETCPYCETPLVGYRPEDPAQQPDGSARPPRIADDEPMEPVIEVNDPTEVIIIKSILEGAAIPYITRGESQFSAFRGTFVCGSILNPRNRGVIFTVPAPSWGFRGVYGSPFSYGQPSLDGPGELKPSLSIVADPVPWACWRGAFAGGQNWYEVTLDPGVSTTVVVPARLEAAPLEGMKTITDFRMENGDDPVLVDADVGVGGTPGILIKTRIAGHDTKLPATIKSGRSFVLRGLTRPALPNRRIYLRAMPNSAAAGGEAYRIATVKTDSKGHFKSDRLKIKYPTGRDGQAIWSYSSRLASPGRFANESSCGPALFLGSGS